MQVVSPTHNRKQALLKMIQIFATAVTLRTIYPLIAQRRTRFPKISGM